MTSTGDDNLINQEEKGTFSLDEIWDIFVEQITLYEERAEKMNSFSLDERLSLQEQILKLKKMIEKAEAAARREQQPKKKFEIYTRLREKNGRFKEWQKHSTAWSELKGCFHE